MTAVRWGLPAAIMVAGIVLSAAVSRDAGAAIAVAGLCGLVAVALFGMAVGSEGDRAREERARAYYDRHGHWPDEARRAGRSGHARRD